MAVKVTGLILPNSGSFIAEAKNIAIGLGLNLETYVNEIKNSIPSEPLQTDLTEINLKIALIEESLEAIGTTADKIQYTYTQGESQITTTVKAELDSLKSGITSIEANKNSTQQFYNQAVEIKSKIDQLKEDIEEIVENTNQNIESLQEVAESFNTSFDADAHFEIISSNTYNAKKIANTLDPNCIYFCYD